MRVNQVVFFDHEDITKLLMEKAKEQIQSETGKSPIGSSKCELGFSDQEGKSIGYGTITFQSNGPVKGAK